MAVFIHQLRRKLGDDIITTVYGRGYVIGGPACDPVTLGPEDAGLGLSIALARWSH